MLNIVTLIKKNHVIRILKKGDIVNINKRGIPFSKEWYNSSYSFNNNPTRFYPAINNFVFKLLKAHFNIYNNNLENKNISTKYLKIKHTLLNNKIWISTPEIKHFNKKAIITFYVYNRLYGKCKKQLNLLEFTWGPIITNKKELSHNYGYNISKTIKVTRKIEILRHENPMYIGTNKRVNVKNKNFYTKIISWLKLDKLIKIQQYKSNMIKLINKDNKTKILNGLNLIRIERYNYLINRFKKELIYLKLKQKILFNQFKFNEMYLVPLIKLLQTIYKKKIEFNIVMVNHHYISSSILAQMTKVKVIDIKNRGNAGKPVTEAIKNNYIPILSNKKVQREKKIFIGINNVIYNKAKYDDTYDTLNKFLLTNKKSKIWSSKYIDNFALQNIENKNIAGIFIKVKGRLTKRYKAQRSIKILRYKGTLKNIYSAHKGYSSVLSRGYSNINIDKTIVNSKVRIGAFGLTGWIASC